MGLQLPYAIVTEMEDVQANFEALSNPKYTWLTPTLINSWANFNPATSSVAGYLKDALGFVHLKGILKGGLTTTTAFVLPAGFRPGMGSSGAAACDGTWPCRWNIDSSGNVSGIFGGTMNFFSFDGVTFLAEN